MEGEAHTHSPSFSKGDVVCVLPKLPSSPLSSPRRTLGLLFGGSKHKPKVSIAPKAKIIVKPVAKPAAKISFSLSFFGIKSK